MATKKTKHNWKSIEKSLLSDDEKMFDSMIKFLEKNGKLEYLSKIIGLLNNISDARKAKVFSFLSKLKQKDAAPIMMEIVKDEKNKPFQDLILNSFWNSSIDYSAYFSEFVEISCKGRYITALECLTILENLKGPFNEAQILDAQLHLKNYLELENKQDDKAPLISEIAVFIKQINDQLSDIDQDILEM
tara:strand:- start:3699 stop:4265 length:567 start_codon:yes stop_codon:yes gene_type:complete